MTFSIGFISTYSIVTGKSTLTFHYIGKDQDVKGEISTFPASDISLVGIRLQELKQAKWGKRSEGQCEQRQ